MQPFDQVYSAVLAPLTAAVAIISSTAAVYGYRTRCSTLEEERLKLNKQIDDLEKRLSSLQTTNSSLVKQDVANQEHVYQLNKQLDSARGEIEELKHQRTELEAMIAKSKHESEKTAKDVSQLIKEQQQQTIVIQAMEAQLEMARDNAAALQMEIEASQSEMADMRNDIGDRKLANETLSGEMAQAHAELANYMSKIESLEKELNDKNSSSNSLMERIDELQQRYDMLKAEKDDLLGQLKTDLYRSREECERLNNSVDKLQKQSGSVEALLNRSRTELDASIEKNILLEDQLKATQTENTNLQTQVAQLNEKLTTTEHLLVEHVAKLNETRQTLEETSANISNLKADLDQYRDLVSELSKRNNELSDELLEKAEEVEGISFKFRSALLENEQLLAELSASKKEIPELHNKVEVLVKQLRSVEEHRDTLTAEKESLETALQTTKTSLEASETLINEMKSQILCQQEEIASVKSENANALGNFEKLSAERAVFASELSQVKEDLNKTKEECAAKDELLSIRSVEIENLVKQSSELQQHESLTEQDYSVQLEALRAKYEADLKFKDDLLAESSKKLEAVCTSWRTKLLELNKEKKEMEKRLVSISNGSIPLAAEE